MRDHLRTVWKNETNRKSGDVFNDLVLEISDVRFVYAFSTAARRPIRSKTRMGVN